MQKTEMTQIILSAKLKLKCKWADLAKVVGLSEVYLTSACLGENVLSLQEANQLATYLDLDPEIAEALTQNPSKGEASPTL
jgi:cyanate lyase